MAYDETLAARVRELLAARDGVDERKMFGGLAFLLRGHMTCGIVGEDLMVRVGPGAYGQALTKPHVRIMDFTGRPLKGMVYVGSAGLRSRAALRRWVEAGVSFASSLPPKAKKRVSSRPTRGGQRPARGIRRN